MISPTPTTPNSASNRLTMSPVRMGEQNSTGKTDSNGVGTTIGSPLGVVHHCGTRHYRLPTRKTFFGERVIR